MSHDNPDTPKLVSSFPQTPAQAQPRAPPRPFGPQAAQRKSPSRPRNATAATTTSSTPAESKPSIPTSVALPVTSTSGTLGPPLIPLDVLDAPTQRLYAIAIFGAAQAYKFYDLSRMWAGEGEITVIWFCMKWWLIDWLFFWYLPQFRIPWLCFSPTASLWCIGAFMLFDLALPHVSIAPVTMLLSGIWKFFYDREMSISERRVKWGDIIHNDTHIMGKYTVHILPEGVAKLNPDGKCFCLGPSSPAITVPIKINGTQPINIQLTRADLETGDIEIIDLSQKEIKRLIKNAPREETPELRYLQYPIKTPGLYRLTKVRDVSELDVRVNFSHALVVTCPKAMIKPSAGSKKDVCRNDMSDLTVQLEGLAPLSVTYSRVIKGRATTLTVGRNHPENFESPLLSGYSIDAHLIEHGYEGFADWAKRVTIPVPLNDSMVSTGDWMYEIDQIIDGCGNLVDYKAHQEEGDSWLPKYSGLGHKLVVHERPSVRFLGCNPQNPMDLPMGRSGVLPIRLDTHGVDSPYKLRLAFTAIEHLGTATEHSPEHIKYRDFTMKTTSDLNMIKEPGLYSLREISSTYCSGDVFEPTSCLVITPPKPNMTMEHDEILDKCTKSSVGLNIDLTLVGTPPFVVSYRLIKDNGPPEVKTLHVDRARHQVKFTPENAGHYAYEFFSLDDKNYNNIQINPDDHHIEQTVKPIAGAYFVDLPNKRKTSCIDEPVEFKVKMQGSKPLVLHYDLIHGGRRTRISEKGIEDDYHIIRTPPLSNGGDYSLVLTSVEDQNGCKVFLEAEAKIAVRFQRPKAQFYPVEGKMSIRALEGKAVKIPMRLSGEAVSHPILFTQITY